MWKSVKENILEINLNFMLTTLVLIAYVPVTPPSRPIEKPPIENCYMQEKVSDWLWKCYTQTEWNSKNLQEEKEKQIQTQERIKFWQSSQWTYQKTINYLLLVVCFFLFLYFASMEEFLLSLIASGMVYICLVMLFYWIWFLIF